MIKRRRKLSKFSSLKEAVNQIGKKKCVLIMDGNCHIASDLTIPSNIQLKFPLNYSSIYSFSIAKDVVLTIKNPAKSLNPLPPF